MTVFIGPKYSGEEMVDVWRETAATTEYESS